MERFGLSCGLVALMVGGLSMAVWPSWCALKNRDEGDDRPLTDGEILTVRVVGVVFFAFGGYGLYALLTGKPGAEFAPV